MVEDVMLLVLRYTYTYSLSKKSLHIEKIKQTSKNALISNIINELFYFFQTQFYNVINKL